MYATSRGGGRCAVVGRNGCEYSMMYSSPSSFGVHSNECTVVVPTESLFILSDRFGNSGVGDRLNLVVKGDVEQ